MPSPFPGMDPFIEGQKWKDFHTALLLEIHRELVAAVRPRYVVEVEEYVYLAKDDAARDVLVAPDVLVREGDANWQQPVAPAQGVLLTPVLRQTPVPDKYEQPFLEIRTRHGAQVITVIEILSPWNKTPGLGRGEYLTKRHNVLASPANLVEIDLLRGGPRLPTTEPLPDGNYFGFVSRHARFPEVEVFAWSLRDALPNLPIPLAEGEPDAVVNLQAAFTRAYDDGGYDYSLDYTAELSPPAAELSPPAAESDARWIEEVVRSKGA